jgi:hypothetical protein
MNRRRWKPGGATGSRSAGALALGALLLTVSPARAQEGVIAAPVAAEPAKPSRPNAVPYDYYTARMVGARRLKVGILAFEYGIIDRLSIGTDPPMYALRGFASIIAPNLHARVNFVHAPGFDLTGVAAGYYIGISHADASGHLWIVPLSLFASVQLAHPLWLHLEGSYNWSRGDGAGDVAKTDVFGTVVLRTGQVGAQLELRLSRVVALTARGRYQFYETPIVFQGDGTIDPYTHVNASIEARPLKDHPAMGVAGVALTWKYVGVVAGGGYGHYFLPGANLAVPHNGFVPEGALWAVF